MEKKLLMPIEVIDYLFLTDRFITNIITQKIVYFFFKEAFINGMLDIQEYKKIENENLFEAWVNGPVNYRAYKRYRKLALEEIDLEEITLYNEEEPILYKNNSEKSIKLKKLLNKVFGEIGSLTKDVVVDKSHDTAWKNARGKLGEDEPSKEPLLLEDIKNEISIFIKNEKN